MTTTPAASPILTRELGVFSATMLGLGSIMGTGVFVSLGLAAGLVGSTVVFAVLVAALLALANALSSAQLAAAHPVAGGTYAYGYRYLTPSIGFTAGWLFLLAKSASAATAALGCAAYLLGAIDGCLVTWRMPGALSLVVIMTLTVLSGVRRASVVNTLIVLVTLGALLTFAIAGGWFIMNADPAPSGAAQSGAAPAPDFAGVPFFEATALLFVAYTGYGRIATLGEEVRQPRRTIPRAIVTTLLVTAVVYGIVAAVAVNAIGADAFHDATRSTAAPLEFIAEAFEIPGVPTVVAIGAVTAMLGVLLNLILGLSRVVLAMGRTGDLPRAAALVDARGQTPPVAVVLVGLGVAGLTLIGDIETTWSFSAFTVLAYYAITNVAALRLPPEDRRFPRAISVLGVVGCVSLAACLDQTIWLPALGLVGLGFVWHVIARRLHARSSRHAQ